MKRTVNWIVILCQFGVNILIGLQILNRIHSESTKLFILDVKHFFKGSGTYGICVLVIVLLAIVSCTVKYQCICNKLYVSWDIRLCRTKFKVDYGMISKRMPVVSILGYVVLIILCILRFYMTAEDTIYVNNYTWSGSKTIGHSFGSIDGNEYTGAYEAFEYYYNLGQRTFEVDLILTEDGEVVLKHDWDSSEQGMNSGMTDSTKEEFLNTPILGKYTSLCMEDLLHIMKQYSDIWIVTDTKYTDIPNIQKEFDKIMEYVDANDCISILDRFIVQIYNDEMYYFMRNRYAFSNYILTLYLYDGWFVDYEKGLSKICRFCVNNDIKIITMEEKRYNSVAQKIVDSYNLQLYLHTIDDLDKAKEYIGYGVDGIYTNLLVKLD